MAAQKGKDLLLKIKTAPSVFTTVAGLRARKIAFNAESADITDQDSVGRWRELLGGTGVQKASVTGSGIFKDLASDIKARELFFNATREDWQIVIPDFGTIAGPFMISALEYAGNHDNEVTFEIALESAGVLTFTVV
jgi:TP901-1 family phage major tail protein